MREAIFNIFPPQAAQKSGSLEVKSAIASHLEAKPSLSSELSDDSPLNLSKPKQLGFEKNNNSQGCLGTSRQVKMFEQSA